MALFAALLIGARRAWRPRVEHRSPTVKRMDHVHLWVYGNTGDDESGFPNSLCTTDF